MMGVEWGGRRERDRLSLLLLVCITVLGVVFLIVTHREPVEPERGDVTESIVTHGANGAPRACFEDELIVWTGEAHTLCMAQDAYRDM